MTTYTESFNKADSTSLGPDLTWTKFSSNDFWMNDGSVNDGEVSSNAYGIRGGDRPDSILGYSDSFDRANNVSSMGDTDGGMNGTATWFSQGGNWGINANRAYEHTGVSLAQSIIFHGYDNQYFLQVTLVAGTDVGLTWRNNDQDNCWHTNKSGQVIKRNGGTPTVAFTLTTGALNDGDILKVLVNASTDTYQFYVNGTDSGSFTDSYLTGQDGFSGLHAASSSNARFDDFKYGGPVVDCAAYARAEHDVGSTSGYTQVQISSMQTSDSNNNPGYWVGTSLDATYTGPLPDGSDAYRGLPGMWAVFEPKGWDPAGCGIYMWSFNPDTNTGATLNFTNFPLGGVASYIQGPILAEGDVIRIDHDAVNRAFQVSVNGTPCGDGTYGVSDLTYAPGQRGGIGIYVFNDPLPYPINADLLDNFETGITSFVGTPSQQAPAIAASGSGSAYGAIATANGFQMNPGRWVLFDASTDETYAFEVNPNEGGSPALKKNINKTNTTAPDGKVLLYEGADDPRTFDFSGVLLTQDQYDTLQYWYDKKHQVILRDDLGRFTYVYLTEFIPRRAGLHYNHYRHTYTCKAVELDWS